MFEQEVSALLDVTAYIEDNELREELEEAIKNTARGLASERKRKAKEEADNAAGLCRFDEAWRGRCNKPSVNDARTLCVEHLGLMCFVRGCDRHAVMTCSATYAFVCGAPVCKKHEHCDRGRH